MKFDTATAQQYAANGRIDEWVYAYLTYGDWANSGMAEGLRLARRWWIGPVELPLDALTRCTGPEDHMEYRIDPAAWDTRVKRIAESFDNLADLPPLIVEYRTGSFSIRDGNHRHEALRRCGIATCWVLIWFNTHEDFLDYTGATLS